MPNKIKLSNILYYFVKSYYNKKQYIYMKKNLNKNKNKSKSIIITGGAGYIGSITAELFRKNGWLPIIVDNLSTGFKENINNLPFYIDDYANENWLKDAYYKYKPQIIMHFAASTIVSESMNSPNLYYQNNVTKFIALLNNMLKYSINNIIFSSSASVYGEPISLPIKEDHPVLPNNVYGHTKKICEEILHFYNITNKINYVSLRYFNAAGAATEFNLGEQHTNETHLIPNILLSLLNKKRTFKLYGNDYPTKDGTCIRDYIHVIDIANAHLLATKYLLNNKKSDIFNIGNEIGYSIKDVIKIAFSITNKEIPIKITCRRLGDPPILIADSKKIKNILGWKPKYSNLETIIKSQWEFLHTKFKKIK